VGDVIEQTSDGFSKNVERKAEWKTTCYKRGTTGWENLVDESVWQAVFQKHLLY